MRARRLCGFGHTAGMNAWEWAEWDAVETAERVKRREVSASEVVEAAITRARDATHLGAIVTPTFERALEGAAKSSTGPLAGVPTFIKDLAQVAGVRTSWGTAAAGHYVSPRSDPSVLAMERAGLISLGKSATPELGLTGTTEPLAWFVGWCGRVGGLGCGSARARE